jgi:2'-5' RNA ligase
MPFLRLFIAIETPSNIIPQIAAMRDRLRTSTDNVRWEPNEKLHATLKFLGDTEETLLPEIVLYLRGVSRESRPMEIRYSGIGCFPNRREPRIIWVGIEETGGLLSLLQSRMESGMTQFGFKKEQRAFHPHLTLGRVKNTRNIASLLRTVESATFDSQPVLLQEFSLIKSILGPTGSTYTVLERYPFEGA